MEQTYDATQLDQSALQGLLGGGGTTSLIPEALVTTLTVGFVVLNLLGVLFLVFYIISLIRKWKVESAILHMQKDLADIKAALSQPAPTSDSNATKPVRPAESSSTIAQTEKARASDERT